MIDLSSTSVALILDPSASGTAYFLAQPAGQPAPSAAEIKQQASSDLHATDRGSVAVSAGIQTPVDLTGLDIARDYRAYAVLEDEDGNLGSGSRILVHDAALTTDPNPFLT